MQSEPIHRPVPALPAAIWALGFVSMLMDISSEMIHGLLPVYLVTVLGTSTVTIGIIEGIAEATASITKVFSGVLSDWLGRRKFLVALGYGLAAFTKPIFPLASSVGWVMAARFIDRIGKGIRDAPRDALIADITPASLRGASFGLRQSLDTVGAVVGPALAIALMWFTSNDYPSVFWLAVIPAFLALGLILFAVREPRHAPGPRQGRSPLGFQEMKHLGGLYWWVVTIASVFTFARFSEAFLILRATSAGLPVGLAPLVLIVMNVVYAAAAYPVGILSDRTNRITVLAAGLGFLIASDLALGFSSGLVGLTIGVMLWGLHLAFTQGLFAALVADAAPAHLRGTAYGFLNLLGGVALLAASAIAGALWNANGPAAPFLAGATFAAIAMIGLLFVHRRMRPRTA